MERIEIEWTNVSLEDQPDGTYCMGLIVASDVNAARVSGVIEGRIYVSYRTYEYSSNALLVVDITKNNEIIRTIDSSFPVDAERIKELMTALDLKKVSCLYVGYLGTDLKVNRCSPYFPVSYLNPQ